MCFHYLLGLLDLSLFSLLSLSSLSLFSLSSSCFFIEASFSCSIYATKYLHLTQRHHKHLIKYACRKTTTKYAAAGLKYVAQTEEFCWTQSVYWNTNSCRAINSAQWSQLLIYNSIKKILPVAVLFLLSSVPEMQLEYQQCFLVHLIAVATVLPWTP